jgi:hypothetical protein
MTPLHAFGNIVRSLLLEIPLPVVRVFFLAVPIGLLIWVLRLSRQQTTPAQETGRWGENLKVGATIALVIQILIYSWL